MLYCPNFFWNVLQVWMTGKDVYLQMTWSWPDKTWNILCSYCLQWNTSQSKFRNHYFLFLFAFSILSQLFLIWGCRKNICKLRKQLRKFYNTHAANAHNRTKQRNALQIKFFIWLCCEHLQCVSLFVCVVSICSTCCQIDDVFLICWCFFFLHVFSEVAAHWALSATVVCSVFKGLSFRG